MEKYVLALDQGTTSCRAVLYDRQGRIAGSKAKEFRQIYPKPGWVEHDPEEIWECQLGVMRSLLKEKDIPAEHIEAIGITNQRETVVVWEKATGRPVTNAIVWQCRRTASICEELKQQGLADMIHKKTGLVIDAYFSGTKLKWILDENPGLRQRAYKGEILAGTIDTWLIWNLTGGASHVTDYSNASRTMLYNIRDLCWDEDLLRILDIPAAILPQVKPSSGLLGVLDPGILGAEIPITGVAGDQQSALFGQACFNKGDVKNTYGTGCFLLMNTGRDIVYSSHNLLTTIAWGLGGNVEYALEGSVFVAGAAVQWLRDELRLVRTAAETEAAAISVEDTGGVYMVPAFVGLGAPYWDMYAQGAFFGLTRGVGRCHLIRAVLESIAYQSRDVLSIMEKDSRINFKQLKADGGASANNFLMQFQSDILDTEVIRPENIETTSMGAAFLAGLETGFWEDKEEVRSIWKADKRYKPDMPDDVRKKKLEGWKRAVESCISFRQP
ncbi:MAG TPA: glycerol kinase GlpK [Candidatus Atribacteria bacterium]|nr:glycerol kinase GlpK [Candidatus Atribacteria bacterium]HPT78278.1 glycerol kinase GlpK [Candidatus Atribacteria bacterium]